MRAKAVAIIGRIGLALGAAGLAGGCSIGSVVADMPSAVGGLPANAPERPAQVAEYPAVHDMPPQRDAKPLSDAEQIRLQQDLAAQRERMGGAKAPRPQAAKKADGAGTGSSRNP